MLVLAQQYSSQLVLLSPALLVSAPDSMFKWMLSEFPNSLTSLAFLHTMTMLTSRTVVQCWFGSQAPGQKGEVKGNYQR